MPQVDVLHCVGVTTEDKTGLKILLYGLKYGLFT